MESNTITEIPSFVRLKREIPIQYKNEQPSEVIQLKNNKCLVQFLTAYLEIDFSSSNQPKIHLIDITKHNGGYGRCFSKTSSPIPHPNGGFIIGLSSMHYFNQKHQCTRLHKIWDRSCPDMDWQTLIYFQSSGLVIHTYHTGNDSPTTLDIITNDNQRHKYSILETIKSSICQADSDSILITQFQRDRPTIKIVDFLSSRKKALELTLPFKYQYKMNFYILDQNFGIVGLKTQQNLFKILKFELKQNGKMDKLIEFKNTSNERFVLINKVRRILILKLHYEQQQYLILFNYQSNKIVWSHKCLYKSKNGFNRSREFNASSLSFSQDLSNYVQIQQQSGKYKIVQFIQVDLKKTYFHLFKKSKLENSFGQRLGRELLKVLA